MRGAAAVEGGSAGPLQTAGRNVVFGTIGSPLELTEAKKATAGVREAVGRPAGAEAFVSGTPAIQADLDPIFEEDLLKGEAIALPIALLVLLAVFGLSFAVLMPFIVAASTITATLGIVWIVAHYMTMAIYVTNLVQLIGLGIAIDYSLLIVYRYREELERGDPKDEAIVRTMATAGRAVVFSGVTVAIGLALLLFMPLPFMVSMGVGGFLIPLLSILAAVTLQPALLSLFGRRGTRRVHVADFLRDRLRLPVPRFAGTTDAEQGLWARLARSIMRRPLLYLAAGATALVAVAAPVLDLQLTPGSASGTPQSPESIRGFNVLREAVGPGALAPTQILVDSGRENGIRAPAIQNGIDELIASVRRDPEVVRVDFAAGRRAPPYIDATGRYAYLSVAGKHEYGALAAQDFARRLREELIPAVGFPEGATVLAGGGPPQGIDFIDSAYGAFPWLVLAVLLLTYLTLMRAFRSLLLPLKAVVLNLLAIAATYGLIVIVFKYGIGAELLGLYRARPGGGMDPDLPLRDALRALDGLRGLPRLADARVLGRGGDERGGGRARARANRPDRDGGGDRDGRGLLGLRGRLDRRPAAVRPRARDRDLHRRDPDPGRARACTDAALRSLQLVAARERRAADPGRAVAAGNAKGCRFQGKSP